jgi:hypothetical protein
MKHLLARTVFALCAFIIWGAASPSYSQALQQTKGDFQDKFRQLDPEELPTPGDYRTASGAPGTRYWQQKVDYKINVALNETGRSLAGSGEIRYKNNSPDTLTYIWFMLDQNESMPNSIAELTRTTSETGRITYNQVRRAQRMRDWKGGFDIKSVTDSAAHLCVMILSIPCCALIWPRLWHRAKKLSSRLRGRSTLWRRA